MEKRALNLGTWQDQFDFSQAIEIQGAQRIVFCAGQVSQDGQGKPLHPGDMVAQFHQALDHLEDVLDQAGLGLADVVRLNYYVTDIPAFLEAVPIVGERLKKAGCQPASTLLGIVRLAKPHGRDALEAACLLAIEIGGLSYTSVNSILKNNLHRRLPEKAADGPAISHPNIRGAQYFH